MSGTDRIIEAISNDARKEADSIIERAKEEAGEKLRLAREEGLKRREEILEKARADAAAAAARRVSQAKIAARNRRLALKRSYLEKVFESAHKSLLDMSDEEYQNLLISMITAAVSDGNGEILLSERDAKRIRPDFEYYINRELSKKGTPASVRLSGERRNISGGFVLKKGDVEYNYSFEAIISSLKTELEGSIAQILFGTEKGK